MKEILLFKPKDCQDCVKISRFKRKNEDTYVRQRNEKGKGIIVDRYNKAKALQTFNMKSRQAISPLITFVCTPIWQSEGLLPIASLPASNHLHSREASRLFSSDWSNFDYLDDDEDLEIDTREYAKEEDTQEYKAQVGATLDAPTVGNQKTKTQGSTLTFFLIVSQRILLGSNIVSYILKMNISLNVFHYFID